MRFKVIIPVRYASTRLPGKPLLNIGDKPMIWHVYNRAVESGAVDVVVATDSTEIANIARDFGAQVCMTSADHMSGTERIAEAAEALGYESDDIIVNLQGDEPLMPPSIIHQVAHALDVNDSARVSTMATNIDDVDDLFNPSIVKVVINKRGYAIYFSRAPIPWERESFAKDPKLMTSPHYRHVGIYAYRVGFLQEYLKTIECDLEKCEMLEQLRMLWNGGKIHVSTTSEKIPHGVDTAEDLENVKKLLQEK
ncbi:MAG: 3-deoxy-manno-octulosonate cytidylyltransferase [Legionellales bacterium]|jgi:3-deoxy-manno-octulosonate cytidylyltransferase (CMP-KDO synthetase)|nr:3-deoxy-manno-octulosonate cytidylyltransferase [Legionellales bacterium]